MKTKTDSSPAPSPASRSDLERALSAIRKQFGEGSICQLGSTQALNVETLSTGSLAVDIALGVGGLPKGRIIEVFGPEASGKTSFCLSLIAETQRHGGVAALIDIEHALCPKWAKTCGVNVDQLLISQPDAGEDALTIAEHLIRSNAVQVIVIDSVAALVPRSELAGEMGDASVGAQGRMLSQAMRRLTAAIAKSGCVCVFTNQLREKIGVVYGPSEYTCGGRALKFFSSIRLDIRKKETLKSPEGIATGNRTKVKVVKNKVAAPFTECEFDIGFDCGICNAGTLIDLGLHEKLLEKKGAWIARNGELLGNGRDAVKQYLRSHSTVAQELTDTLRSRLLFGGGSTGQTSAQAA